MMIISPKSHAAALATLASIHQAANELSFAFIGRLMYIRWTIASITPHQIRLFTTVPGKSTQSGKLMCYTFYPQPFLYLQFKLTVNAPERTFNHTCCSCLFQSAASNHTIRDKFVQARDRMTVSCGWTVKLFGLIVNAAVSNAEETI